MIELTNDTFEKEVEESDLPVLLDFWAEWCAPCKNLAPIVESLAEDYKGQLKVYKVLIDDCSEIVKKYNISALPTLLIIKDKECIYRKVGLISSKELKKKIDEIL